MSAEARSLVAQEKCSSLLPFIDPDQSEKALDETDEALSLLTNQSPLLVDVLPDLRAVIDSARAGGSLTAQELLAIKETLSIGRRARNALNLLSPESFPRLTDFIASLPTIDKLRQEIERCLDDQGEVKDEASPALKNLRNGLKRLQAEIKQELHRLIHSSDVSKALQEPIFTQRSGRYVLPVDVSKRGTVYGIVHDSSQSGLTVYIEPMSIVEPSNKARLQEGEIEREIERILLELSSLAHSHVDDLQTAFNTLIEIDVILARARLATRYGGMRPEISRDDRLHLIDARHPLLVLQKKVTVVGNDLTLGGGDRTLVITGPNTGGKTVLLKQAGLIALMLKAGMLVPAKPGSAVPIYKRVWADIGDEQSLVQSLSTFSSHMKNIVEIIDKAASETLILLDEIGAGTDPKEGAALARSVLEHLNRSGATTISTTHFGELKMLAYQEPGFVNGSLAFDEVNLAPTYRLRLGIAGSSKATSISQRLGLDANVVDRARQLLAGREEEISRAMEELERRSKLVQDKERALDQERDLFEQSKEQFESQRRVDLEEIELKRLSYAEQIERQFKEAQETIKNLIREMQKNPTSKSAQETRDKLEHLRKELGWLESERQQTQGQERQKETIQAGSRVKIPSLNQTGVVESLSPGDGNKTMATVQCANMRIKVAIEDLVPFKQNAASAARKSRAGLRSSRSAGGSSPPAKLSAHGAHQLDAFIRTSGNTLDLRGERVDAALGRLERFLDQCTLDGVSPVMIIHGHGTGAMKVAVRENLAISGYVLSFRPGELYEGGDGVTIVSVK